MIYVENTYNIRRYVILYAENTQKIRIIYADMSFCTHDIRRKYAENTQKIRERVLFTHTTDERIFCVNKNIRMIRRKYAPSSLLM